MSSVPELTEEQIREIKEQIQRRSGNETVLNEELFGPVQPDTIIIAVQVSGELCRCVGKVLGVGAGVAGLYLSLITSILGNLNLHK